jgi:glyoxylase-like metal-dependent hydrolase (beta-lactamase superfamily II)
MSERKRGDWLEIADGVLVRRYRFFDQGIGLVLGDGAALVIDTRTTPSHARELQADIRAVTSAPVEAVVNTHAHSDHCFGNSLFDPVAIWGQRGAVRWLERTGEQQRTGLADQIPDLAEDLAGVVLRPPDRLVDERAVLQVGGRRVELSFHGPAHTDHDLVVAVPDADVVFAGDIVEEGNAPWFGDGDPEAWPATLDAFLAARPEAIVVPGHGSVADRAFVAAQREAIGRLAAGIGRVAAGDLEVDALVAADIFPEPTVREAFARALAIRAGTTGSS